MSTRDKEERPLARKPVIRTGILFVIGTRNPIGIDADGRRLVTCFLTLAHGGRVTNSDYLAYTVESKVVAKGSGSVANGKKGQWVASVESSS